MLICKVYKIYSVRKKQGSDLNALPFKSGLSFCIKDVNKFFYKEKIMRKEKENRHLIFLSLSEAPHSFLFPSSL